MELKKSIPLVLLIFMTLSCSYVNPGLYVFWGNYNMGQGKYQEANVAYLNALEWQNNEDLISYNLGNAYYSLGESESALIKWDNIEVTDRDFQFRLIFNKGIYYYERGLYYEAAQSFKKAVLISPNDIDGKINLELSLNRVNTGYDKRGGDQENSTDDTLIDDTERLLNYLQRRETLIWESSEEKPKRRRNDW